MLMRKHHHNVTLDCCRPGCPTSINADPRHLPNLVAGGGWYCHEHDGDHVEEEDA